jgi:hypothetical protein
MDAGTPSDALRRCFLMWSAVEGVSAIVFIVCVVILIRTRKRVAAVQPPA